MKGLIFETSSGWAFVRLETIISVKQKGRDEFKVWYAQGYTNAEATVDSSSLGIRDYDEYLKLIS